MIISKRIRLRAVEREDLPRFQRWLNDEEVTAGLTINLPLSLVDEDTWFQHMLTRPAEEHPLVIEACQGEAWVPIGNVGFIGIDTLARSGEIGIFIGEKSFWNQGFGTQVMRMMVRHGFETLNLNRVYLRVYDTNPRAIRSYERAGFIHEGRMRQAAYKHGHYIDVLWMSVIRQEWEATAQEIEE